MAPSGREMGSAETRCLLRLKDEVSSGFLVGFWSLFMERVIKQEEDCKEVEEG